MGDLILNGIVLAGGNSSRMGTNKALIEILGVPMLLRQISKLEVVLEGYPESEILVSVRELGVLELPEKARYVDDLTPGEGPLMGIYTCLKTLESGHVVVLGVDMPRIDPMILCELVECCEPGIGIVPGYRSSGFFEPLAAIYPIEMVSLIGKYLESGKRSLQELVRLGIEKRYLKKHEIAKMDVTKFMNVNCPQDFVEYADD